MKLTRQQQSVFDFICEFSKENGFPPSYANISQEFNFKSDGTVRTYLEHLEKKGYIQRLGQARGIKILKPKTQYGIPIVGKIAAGDPTLAIENEIGSVSELTELQFKEGRFALQVQGDSMKDAGIMNGDLAIIQLNMPVTNGQIAAVYVDGHATLKRIYYEQNRVRLQPENEFYDPIYLNRSDFDAHIIGRYIALIRLC